MDPDLVYADKMVLKEAYAPKGGGIWTLNVVNRYRLSALLRPRQREEDLDHRRLRADADAFLRLDTLAELKRFIVDTKGVRRDVRSCYGAGVRDFWRAQEDRLVEAVRAVRFPAFADLHSGDCGRMNVKNSI